MSTSLHGDNQPIWKNKESKRLSLISHRAIEIGKRDGSLFQTVSAFNAMDP